MEFIKDFIRNLIIAILAVGIAITGGVIFASIFYPETLPILETIVDFIAKLNLWPIVALSLIVSAIPRRRRKRQQFTRRNKNAADIG